MKIIKIGSMMSIIHFCNSAGIGFIDILIVAETKLDLSFPTAQFLIPAFHHLFRLDINRRSGGLTILTHQQILKQ